MQLSRLKHLYEQWFQGIERIEPLIPRKQLERTHAHLLRKSAASQHGASLSLSDPDSALHDRCRPIGAEIGRQIEEGTYRRDLSARAATSRGPARRA